MGWIFLCHSAFVIFFTNVTKNTVFSHLLGFHLYVVVLLQLLVLKYVQNKDVFMRYHKAHLTRRLILDTSADNEKEENMVEWLRVSTWNTLLGKGFGKGGGSRLRGKSLISLEKIVFLFSLGKSGVFLNPDFPCDILNRSLSLRRQVPVYH